VVANDLAFFTQDSNQFGETIARTKRVISKLLLDWANGKEEMSQPNHSRRPNYLTAIYFDKLVELYCRIWDELNSQGKVRYPSGFQKQRGFHGPGRAIRISRTEDEKLSLGVDPLDFRRHKWAFATEIVEKLKPSIGNARLLFSLSKNPWDPRCRISSEIDPAQWEAWLKDSDNLNPQTPFLTSIEEAYIIEISKISSSLTHEELRVLGTHFSPVETYEDIRFNLRNWNDRFQETMDLPYSDRTIKWCTYQLVTTTREIKRKSIENRRVYEAARKKALASSSSLDISNVIQVVQKTPDEIWGDERIVRFARAADALLNLSIYIRCGINQINQTSILSKKEIKEGEDAYSRLLKPWANVTLDLKHYPHLTKDGVDTWIPEVIAAKETVFGFLPPLKYQGDFGIP